MVSRGRFFQSKIIYNGQIKIFDDVVDNMVSVHIGNECMSMHFEVMCDQLSVLI